MKQVRLSSILHIYLQIETFYKQRQEVGLCYPKNYEEHYLRVFVKNEDKFEAAKYAFHNMCTRHKEEMGELPMSPERSRQYSSQRRLSQENNRSLYSQNSTAQKRESSVQIENLEQKLY